MCLFSAIVIEFDKGVFFVLFFSFFFILVCS